MLHTHIAQLRQVSKPLLDQQYPEYAWNIATLCLKGKTLTMLGSFLLLALNCLSKAGRGMQQSYRGFEIHVSGQ